jgi:hypothetical protein
MDMQYVFREVRTELIVYINVMLQSAEDCLCIIVVFLTQSWKWTQYGKARSFHLYDHNFLLPDTCRFRSELVYRFCSTSQQNLILVHIGTLPLCEDQDDHSNIPQ